MDDAARIATAKNYLRRKYRDNVDGLRVLMDQVASEALGEHVTIIGSTFEGGSANGVVAFPRLEYLSAVMAVLDEVDPDNAPEAPAAVRHADFSRSPLET